VILTDYFRGLLNAVIPNACLLCGGKLNSEDFLCQDCLNFDKNIPPFCSKCGLSASVDLKTKICRRCLFTKFHFSRNFSPFLFKEPLSRLIYLFKYEGYSFLGEFFAGTLINFTETLNSPITNYDFITCVPLHKRKLREREYNQSRILAWRLSENFGISFRDVLRVKRYLKSQIVKDYRQRQLDVRGNFSIKGDVKGKNIILLDDVFTTGATVSECSRVLKENGAKNILVITLAIRKPDYTDNHR